MVARGKYSNPAAKESCMRVYVGFDDTDVADADRGTGKFARWFAKKLPDGVELYGVVRQQLPVLDGIPYTSHNSSACLILDNVEQSQIQDIIDRGGRIFVSISWKGAIQVYAWQR
jgi:hypothetical protein